ncbi:MAG: hypothetical protein R3C02_12975 [Planctomycetaceae bacterium]
MLSKLDVDPTWKVQLGRKALQDENPDVRVAAIRMCRQLRDQFDVADIHDVIDLQDPSPAVRREMLIGLRELNIPAGAVVWAELALQHDRKDRWYLEALGIGADLQWDECLQQWLSLSGKAIDTPAGRDIVWRSQVRLRPELLAEIILNPNTPREQLPRMFRSFDFQRSPTRQQALESLAVAEMDDSERQLFVNAEALERLDGIKLADRQDLTAPINRVLDASPETPRFVKLIQQFDVRDRDEELVSLIVHDPQSQLSMDAANVLLHHPSQPTLREVLVEDDIAAGEAILAAIGATANGHALELVHEVMNDESRPIALRRAAVKALGEIPKGAQELLSSAKAGTIEEPLLQATASALHASTDEKIRQQANELFPLPAAKDSEPLPPLSELLSRKGNIDMGRIVFHSTGTCTKCHIVNGIGREIGPNLSEIGKKLAKPAMFESILYPSAGISHNYESWTIVTIDGQVLTGLLVSETPDEVQIKDVNAIVHAVKTEDIDLRKKQDVSIMPADLQKVMSANDLVDVVEYLTTLKQRTQ